MNRASISSSDRTLPCGAATTSNYTHHDTPAEVDLWRFDFKAPVAVEG